MITQPATDVALRRSSGPIHVGATEDGSLSALWAPCYAVRYQQKTERDRERERERDSRERETAERQYQGMG